MEDNIFIKELYHIEGDSIELGLIDTYKGKNGELPFYWWNIILKPNNVVVGKISFRIGHNYALLACQLVLKAARYHKMGKIYLTCDYDNVASYKTIEKLGANLIEEVLPPDDYIFYYEGIEIHRIYELAID